MKKNDYLKLYLLLLGIFLGSVIIGRELLIFKYSFPYVQDFLSKQGPALLWPLANFDGVHYLLLAQEGYVRDLYQAFFPVYPLLIRFFANFIKNYLFSSLLISHISFLVAIYYFYKLLRIDFNKKICQKALLFFIFFPTSFYLLSAYSESLFLAFMFSFFYYLRKKRIWKAALLAGIASAVRFVGVFLLVPFLMELFPTFINKKKIKKIIPLAATTMLSLSGFILYALFLFKRYSDPLKFIHVQSAFGADRTSGKIVLLYQVFYRYLKMFITVDRSNPIFFTISLEFVISLLFLILLLLALFVKKLKIRQSYAIFSLLAFVLPTLTGTLSSMPRYVLACFTGFMVLAQIKNKILMHFLLFVSFLFLIICATLFSRGYWIA